MVARIINLQNLAEAKQEIKSIGTSIDGVELMAPKAVQRIVKIKDIPIRLAHIIKQEMLSKSGEAAVSYSAVQYKGKKTDILLMGNLKQYERTIEVLKSKNQPKALKEVAQVLEETIKNYENLHFPLKFADYSLSLGNRTLIMGILNITPDSFSGDGLKGRLKVAINRAKKMVEEGADIIDVGGESTRPGAKPVDVEEECNRIIPVISQLRKSLPVPISVDTYKSKVAVEAIKAGASIINDISGLRFDPKMKEVAANFGTPLIIMHIKGTPADMQKNPHYEDVIGEIIEYLAEGIEMAKNAGVEDKKIIIDPGIGFGKTTEHNLKILRNLREFKSLGKPILVGTSRKSLIGNVLNLPIEERLEGTAATVALSIANGADIVRVHDVKEMSRVVRMTDAVVRSRM